MTFATNDAFTKAAADQVEALKDADVVICLAHLGVDGESKPYRSTDLYAAVKGIDFIIDGHSHTVMTKGENGRAHPVHRYRIRQYRRDRHRRRHQEDREQLPLRDQGRHCQGRDRGAAAQKIIDRIDKEYGAVFAKSEVVLNGAKAPTATATAETNNGDDHRCDGLEDPAG